VVSVDRVVECLTDPSIIERRAVCVQLDVFDQETWVDVDLCWVLYLKRCQVVWFDRECEVGASLLDIASRGSDGCRTVPND
jgi:hypothetical protein